MHIPRVGTVRIVSPDYGRLQFAFRDRVDAVLSASQSTRSSNHNAIRRSQAEKSSASSPPSKKLEVDAPTADASFPGASGSLQRTQRCPSRRSSDLLSDVNIYEDEAEMVKAWDEDLYEHEDVDEGDSGCSDQEKHNRICSWLANSAM